MSKNEELKIKARDKALEQLKKPTQISTPKHYGTNIQRKGPCI